MSLRVRRLVIVLIVLSVLGLVGGVAATRMTRARLERELARQAADLLPDVAQRIQNFHRMKVDKGRKVWEVAAREARYHADENTVVVIEPSVSFFLEDGRSVALTGRQGRVRLDGHELDHVDLDGEIHMQFGDYAVRTDSARYDRHDDTIVAPGHVSVIGEELDVQGDQLELDLSTQRLRLRENVRVVMRPSPTRGPNGPA
jgi:LPS export ABC transporter protein LptC